MATLVVALQPARAATTTCAQFGTVSINGNQYIYQQNEWNSSLGQCASVDASTGAWSLTQASFNLPTNGAPATYPSVFRGCHWGNCTTGSGLPIQVSALGTATSSWSTTQVASGAYNVSYDLWTNSTPSASGQPNGSEIMIWLASRGGVQPAGQIVGTATIGGATWNVWTTRMSSWNYIAYQRTTGTTSVSDLDLKAFIQDSVSRGSTNSSWYLLDAEAGFEIWQGGQGLGSRSFSFAATSGGGGSDGQAPTTPGNLHATGTTSSSVSLAWNASTDNVGVSGYTIYRGGAPVGTTPSTSFTDGGLAASTAYSYRVDAFDSAGNHSASTNPVSATTQSAGGGAASMKAQYRNYDRQATDNEVKPGLRLVNTGTSTVTLSGITVRYWFTRDGGASTFSTWCDYALMGCGGITEQVVNLATPRNGADAYLQVGFTSGSLAPGASTGDTQLRFNKTDWSNFNEVGDYSYRTNRSYKDTTSVTVYQNGTLIWGTEPSS
jgi:hypothetical protein